MTTTASTTASAQGTEEIQDAGYVDVLIVGAGVSGIGAAYHLRDQFPDRTFVILDAQDNRCVHQVPPRLSWASRMTNDKPGNWSRR